MKLILIFIFLTTKLFSQINFELAAIIDSMATKDQFYDGIVRRVENKELDSIKINDALKLRQKCFLDNYFLAKQILSGTMSAVGAWRSLRFNRSCADGRLVGDLRSKREKAVAGGISDVRF